MVKDTDKLLLAEGIRTLVNMTDDKYADARHEIEEFGWKYGGDVQDFMELLLKNVDDTRSFLGKEIPHNTVIKC